MDPSKGKLLRLHICEHDHWRGKPLFEAVVERCREMGMAGVTVFKGVEGYGESSEIHRPHVLAHHQPILITIADTPENIERLVPVVEGMMTTGMIAISDVEMIRVQKRR